MKFGPISQVTWKRRVSFPSDIVIVVLLTPQMVGNQMPLLKRNHMSEYSKYGGQFSNFSQFLWRPSYFKLHYILIHEPQTFTVSESVSHCTASTMI